MTTKVKLRELADDLEMRAAQIREFLESPANHAPHPWVFDKWFKEYRECFDALHK